MSFSNRITDEQFNNLVHDVADVIDEAKNGLDQIDRSDLNEKLERLLENYGVMVTEYLCPRCEDKGEIDDPSPCGRCGVRGCRTMKCPDCDGIDRRL